MCAGTRVPKQHLPRCGGLQPTYCWLGLRPSSMLGPPEGRYTTLRDLDSVPAMSRAASMRRSSIRPVPACRQGEGAGGRGQ